MNKKKKKSNDSYALLIVFFIVVIALWGLNWYYLEHRFSDKEVSNRGLFGDMFGSANALFSGLALAGIIYTILLQKKELSLQRKELNLTRKEFKTQNETLKKQRFENTFFHLISLHNEIVDKLSYEEPNISMREPKNYTQREFFMQAVSALRQQGLIKGQMEQLNLGLAVIRNEYKIFDKTFSSHLSHYFRNLYHIYKYTHQSELISLKEKEFYCGIIRAQLSDWELVLIFYNMLIPDRGYPKFKYLDQKYNVLKNLDINKIFHVSHQSIFQYAEVKEDPFIKEI